MAQDSPLSLLDVSRAPGCVEVMKSHEPSLDIGACPHLFGGAEKYPNPAPIHAVKQQPLGGVGICVVNERDLLRWNAGGDQLRPNVGVDVEFLGIRSRQVAEDELCRALVPSVAPNLDDPRNRPVDLAVGRRLNAWLNQAHVQCGFSSLVRYLEHVVHGRVDPVLLQLLSALG